MPENCTIYYLAVTLYEECFKSIHVTYVEIVNQTLGISKYSSNILTLNELGTYPLQTKLITITLGVIYCLCMAQGTGSVLLNSAFSTMKKEDHQWLKNIRDALVLGKIGLGDVWLNPRAWGKTTYNCIVAYCIVDSSMPCPCPVKFGDITIQA